MARISKEEAFKQVTKPVNRFHGVLTPWFMKEEDIEREAACVGVDPTDIWIVTYPKSGTTWVQQIVKLILNGFESDKTVLEAVPWVEANGLFKVDISSLGKPRAFKSHFSYELLPCGQPNTTHCKYIYVLRNPKDVAVSYYFHYCRSELIPGVNLQWDVFFANFLNGNVYWGDYFDHVLSWWVHRDEDNVLFIKFEDMKKDLTTAVNCIAKFIGFELTDDVISKVVERATFDVMKNDKTANYSQFRTT